MNISISSTLSDLNPRPMERKMDHELRSLETRSKTWRISDHHRAAPAFPPINATMLVKNLSLHIFRFITDEPEIDVEAEKVHSGVGKEAHLTCIVHGEPRPSVSDYLNVCVLNFLLSHSFQVRWFKENSELSNNNRVKIESKESSHRHTLILRGLASQRDFGNYSCVAENSLGSSK